MSIATPDRFGAQSAASLTERLTGARRDVRGRIVEWILLSALGLSLLILVALVVNLVDRAWPVLDGRLGDFLSSGLDASNAAEAGVWQAIRGTLTLAIIVAIVAFPLGIACAIYLEEYAGQSRIARLIRINVRNLAGVPSIVYGILGLTIFVKFSGGLTGGRTVIAGGLTLATLVLPVVIITASEALRAVPQSIREGALGVGATKWEAVRSHVLHRRPPASSPEPSSRCRGQRAKRHLFCSSVVSPAFSGRATRASGNRSPKADSPRCRWPSSRTPGRRAPTSRPSLAPHR